MQQVAFGKGNTMARFASWREMQQVDLHIAPCKRKVFGSIPKAGTTAESGCSQGNGKGKVRRHCSP
jgi:hypothetical protein